MDAHVLLWKSASAEHAEGVGGEGGERGESEGGFSGEVQGQL